MPVNQLILTVEEYDKEKGSFKLQENKYKFRLCPLDTADVSTKISRTITSYKSFQKLL